MGMKGIKEKNEVKTDGGMKDATPAVFQQDFPLSANIILKITYIKR
jgi:hypothetical protein